MEAGMSEMVERLALAMDRASPDFADDGVSSEAARFLARIAIAQMREPTVAMLKAGEVPFGDVDRIICLYAAREAGAGLTWKEGKPPLWHAWRAMIDAALRDNFNG
jgi:hypothetical protein